MKNAIVMMFDSLQFNYLGCYGNTWIKTPNMDRLAREGVLFENCYIEGLPTIPCRRAMHTGRYTMPDSGWRSLRMEDTTIADLCWGRPIDTALVFDCPNYRLPKFGYTRGFDKVWFTHGHEADDFFFEEEPLLHAKAEDYIDEKSDAAFRKIVGDTPADAQLFEMSNFLRNSQNWKSPDDRFVAKTIHKAIEYLEQVDRNKQFYLWIDSFDPHEPWNGPSVYMNFPCPYDPDYKGKDEFMPFVGLVEGIYTEEQLNHVRMLYAELVTLCDTYLGQLMDAIRRLGFEENTMLFMVSDHGEPMGNGKDGHGLMRKVRPWPYEELVHAPMILRAPGIKAGQRITAFVQSVDVAPTVCDWLGIGVHPAMQGKSLLPLIRGEIEKVRDFAIAGYYKYSWSIITEEWSYIHWLANQNDDNMAQNFYAVETNQNILAMGGEIKMPGQPRQKPGEKSELQERHDAAMSLDGEEQWTCSPGSVAEVPLEDELYDRRNDPFQLVNLIDQHPDVAKKLLFKLTDFMDDLRA